MTLSDTIQLLGLVAAGVWAVAYLKAGLDNIADKMADLSKAIDHLSATDKDQEARIRAAEAVLARMHWNNRPGPDAG